MKLYKGDCLEVMKEIEAGSIDAIITDPPYGTTACKWDSVIDFELMWEQLNRVIKPNGAIVLFSSEPFSSALRMSNIKNYKYELIWKKSKCGSPFTAKYKPLTKHENISIFEKKGKKTTYNPQMVQGKPYKRTSKKGTNNMGFGAKSGFQFGSLDGKRYPSTILDFPQKWRRQDQVHPTQKPVELMEYLIKTYTNENETVLDFTMGSGSTGVACVNTNRNFIGIEMDSNYFEIAEQRIKEAEFKLF
jgi:site-specific DNA-methyltransferase (adenine-specific)